MGLTKIWRDSTEYQELVTILSSISHNEGIDITTCICLCLGTLSGKSWTVEYDSCEAAMS